MNSYDVQFYQASIRWCRERTQYYEKLATQSDTDWRRGFYEGLATGYKHAADIINLSVPPALSRPQPSPVLSPENTSKPLELNEERVTPSTSPQELGDGQTPTTIHHHPTEATSCS